LRRKRPKGHTTHITNLGWSQCDACGMWLREKRTVEEREDEPPEDELDSSTHMKRLLDATKARLDERKKPKSD
jgi:hypothetical protein